MKKKKGKNSNLGSDSLQSKGGTRVHRTLQGPKVQASIPEEEGSKDHKILLAADAWKQGGHAEESSTHRLPCPYHPTSAVWVNPGHVTPLVH